MAIYKVIQDVEAEDKFIGPLTLKQFIFAGITLVSVYLSFFFITKHLWFLALPLFPIIVAGGFLAFPWGRDQPTEVWLLAKLRFMLKPRQRIWDQSGVLELVTITAPKRDVTQYTNNLSQTEVESRLQVLAKTIDSRGWAIKSPNVNVFNPAGVIAGQFSDRLIDPSSLPQQVPDGDVYASDDIMDAQNNPLAQHLDQMISTSSQTHRQAVMDQMDKARETADNQTVGAPAVGMPAPNYWFINQPDPTLMPTASVTGGDDPGALPAVQAGANELSPEEKALLDQLHHEQEVQSAIPANGHLRVIQPLSVQAQQAKAKKQASAIKPYPLSTPVVSAPKPAPPPVTPPPSPAILELAVNNDRDVASLAREANAKSKKDQPSEVVIKLR